MARPETVLVTGATGYIGGRLVPLLVEEGRSVRVLERGETRARSHPWSDQVDVVTGDVFNPEALSKALAGVDPAYYLIHSMARGPDFHELDGGRSFVRQGSQESRRQAHHLSGRPGGSRSQSLPPFALPRQETGDVLRESGVPVTEFRAAVVIGSGSTSFEMIRHLVERLPVMVCPRWIYSRIQPIAVDDLLAYLVSALSVPESAGHIIEIGGNDVTTYKGLMLGYASARSLRRLLLPVPVLTPNTSWTAHIDSSIIAPSSSP